MASSTGPAHSGDHRRAGVAELASRRQIAREFLHSGSCSFQRAAIVAPDSKEFAGRLAGAAYSLVEMALTGVSIPLTLRISRAKPHQVVAPAAVR